MLSEGQKPAKVVCDGWVPLSSRGSFHEGARGSEDGLFGCRIKKMGLAHVKNNLDILIGSRRVLVIDPGHKTVPSGIEKQINFGANRLDHVHRRGDRKFGTGILGKNPVIDVLRPNPENDVMILKRGNFLIVLREQTELDPSI